MSQDANPAAPSAADPFTPNAASSLPSPVQEAVASGNFDAFRDAKRPPSTPTLDATPAVATPVVQAASTDVTEKADPEPAKGKEPPKKVDAKTRGAQLDQEIADLNEKLRIRAVLRQELAQTAPAPAATPAADAKPPTAAEWERYRDMPDAPKQDKFTDYGDWVIAMGTFVADQRFAEHQTAEASKRDADRLVQDHATRTADFHKKVFTAIADEPDALATIDPVLLGLTPSIELAPGAKRTFGNVFADQLLTAENPYAIMRYITDHPDEKGRLASIAARDPNAFYAEFGRLDARLTATPAEAAKPAPVKTITEAPHQATILGRKGADAVNPVKAAVQADDFASFQAARLAERTAGQRR